MSAGIAGFNFQPKTAVTELKVDPNEPRKLSEADKNLDSMEFAAYQSGSYHSLLFTGLSGKEYRFVSGLYQCSSMEEEADIEGQMKISNSSRTLIRRVMSKKEAAQLVAQDIANRKRQQATSGPLTSAAGIAQGTAGIMAEATKVIKPVPVNESNAEHLIRSFGESGVDAV